MLIRISFIFAFIFGLILTACGGQGNGFAPGVQPPSPSPSVVYETNVKYGETITTANAWEVSLDTSDPAEEVTLVNGWVVEVSHE